MDLNKRDEMRIRIKFNPTVAVTTTDFVKPSLGVFMSEVIDAMKKWENSLVRGTPRMLVLFLGVTFALASTALAECPDVGISAQASDR